MPRPVGKSQASIHQLLHSTGDLDPIIYLICLQKMILNHFAQVLLREEHGDRSILSCCHRPLTFSCNLHRNQLADVMEAVQFAAKDLGIRVTLGHLRRGPPVTGKIGLFEAQRFLHLAN